jgi:hypothetical protein
MKRMTLKDLALVAFAGGLLAIEVAGLQAAAPIALQTLTRVAGLSSVQAASHSARLATESMLNGFSTAAAQAAVAGVQGAVQSAAEQVAAAAPVTVRRTSAPAHVCSGYRYLVVVGERGATITVSRAQLAALRAERARVRAIRAERRAAEVTRRAIETTIEASAL